MSNSRLEKFIYAICSMDVSDLPVPLSRIEKLWNCLITGETPDFEPLSRNEKYLMAMLDRYDISNLPAPMSRGEKLLYKIAVGETDLSDVPGYLSRYEELLKYLIENGGIGFEYVLYTLNQSLSTLYSTEEKPVKSAILKGQTLVNLFDDKCYDISNWEGSLYKKFYFEDLEVNKEYVFYAPFKGVNSSRDCAINIKAGSRTLYGKSGDTHGTIKVSFTLEDGEELYFDCYRIWGDTLREEYPEIMIIESKYYYDNIPYFEGMQSVKMPVLKTVGKNLLNPSLLIETPNVVVDGGNATINIVKDKREWSWVKIYDNLNLPVGNYYILCEVIDGTYIGGNIGIWDNNLELREFGVNSGKLFSINNRSILKMALWQPAGNNNCKLRLSIYTNSNLSYEPYKSNILTVNEDVTLRSNGDVCDELDLLTGKLTQRIDEDGEVLVQEVVKTVDLTTVDQDGQPTKIKTFNDVTYVEINADNLIPSVDVEVATKISETLSTLGLEHHDISNTQNQLGQTIDEQTENTDATMLATTEIYEQTL